MPIIRSLDSRRAARDRIWEAIREEVTAELEREPVLATFLHATVLNHPTLEDALGYLLAGKLDGPNLPSMLIRDIFDEVTARDADFGVSVRADLEAVVDRDPAATQYSPAFLYFKGFHALQSYRIAHWLWGADRRALALFFQSRISEVFGVDIHPAARIGKGILIDHATAVVVGETAVIEDDVSMLHQVTLGGTGKETGDRHPKVRRGVLIGAGATILGNVEIGESAKVGAGSVVLRDVRAHCTVAGVPAREIACPEQDEPSRKMDHRFPCQEG